MSAIRSQSIWRLLWEASTLDVFDLAYEFSAEHINSLSVGKYWEKKNGFPRKGIFIRAAIFFWHFYGSLADLWRSRNKSIPEHGVIFFAASKNEIDTFKSLIITGCCTACS